MKNILIVAILSATTFFGYNSIASSAGWKQFGHDRGNTGKTDELGPQHGLNHMATLITGTGSEVGVLIDDTGDVYVSSYNPDIFVFDSSGNPMGSFTFPPNVIYGSRAVPLLDTSNNLIYAGTESGGFYVIEVNKSTIPYSLTLVASDNSMGSSESPPVMGNGGYVYIAGMWGDVYCYQYAGGTLTLINSYSLGEVINGAIALFNVDIFNPEDEVIVGTKEGNLFVLSHDLSSVISSYYSTSADPEPYYGGVTIGLRGPGYAPIAIMGIGFSNEVYPNSGIIRAINLNTMAIEWELIPSHTTIGVDKILGSISLVINFAKGIYCGVASSTDGYLYGFDLQTGAEIWDYQMNTGGYAAPVVDIENFVYVADGQSVIHVVEGIQGIPIYTDSSINFGGIEDIGKLALGPDKRLAIGSGSSAYLFAE